MFPQSTTTPAQFGDLFATPLPRGLRDEAAEMSPTDAYRRYGHSAGPLRIGNWECTGRAGSPTRLGSHGRCYRATIAVGDRIATSAVTADGPLAALTAMLHDRGVALEMLNFHQLRSGAYTATFIQGSNGVRARWAMGWSVDAGDSALRAVITCVNRLLQD